MTILSQLKKIKELYSKGENIINFIKSQEGIQNNSMDGIMISYDFQAGSYIKYINEHPEYINNYSACIAKEIEKLSPCNSILEVGVGEATTLANVISHLKNKPSHILGFDISWSRIKFAKNYVKEKGIGNPTLFIGDLFDSPIQDNSIDIVYTSHSIEPNGGKEKEALIELYRIAKKYIVLLEPSYELASNEGKARMEKLGYVKNLAEVAKGLGYNIVEHRLFDFFANPLNPTGLIIIEKSNNTNSKDSNSFLACPVTKAPLELIKNSYYCRESLLAYPIIDEVPCLLGAHSVIAAHYLTT